VPGVDVPKTLMPWIAPTIGVIERAVFTTLVGWEVSGSAAFISVWIATKTIGGGKLEQRDSSRACQRCSSADVECVIRSFRNHRGTHDPPLSTHREALAFTPLSLPPSVGFEQRNQVRRFPPSRHTSGHRTKRDAVPLLAMSGGNRIYMLRMASREGPFSC